MKSAVLTLALWLAAGPALALSCMAPDVASSFNRHAEADEAYVVLYGDFSYPTPPSSETGDINAPRTVEVAASFTGQALTRRGFAPTAPLTVTIRLECLAAWCGGLPAEGRNMLAFVEKTQDSYTLSVGPCGGSLFSRLGRGDIARVEACMRGETCEGGRITR